VKPTVAYGTFCCKKDKDRAHENFLVHIQSHNLSFDEVFFVHQRCAGELRVFLDRSKIHQHYDQPWIVDEDYGPILSSFGIQYPDPILDELTHGWGAPHFWAHHMVNHLTILRRATTDYIAFADADCHMKDQPERESWIEKGIRILESDPSVFVISPNDGGPERRESIMSQQMFLVNRKRFLGMEFIPLDKEKHWIDGGPFQEYYGLLEGWIGRYMTKNNLHRYVLPSQWRYWHKEWH